MRRCLVLLVWLTFMAGDASAQSAPAAGELTSLLNQFLEGASRNDVAVHDRFWGEDLIYTRSAGRRVTKADVMRDVRAAGPARPGEPATRFSAEDIQIQQYGDTAVVAFRLVGTSDRAGVVELSNNLNTGTFVKRDGEWEVVAWQSTRMPPSEETARQQVTEVETALQSATLAGDVRKLGGLLDDGFRITFPAGEQFARADYLSQLGSGVLRYSKLSSSRVTVSVFGETAIVRGVVTQQRSAFPGSIPPGDTKPMQAAYTMTLVNRGGSWRVVALHLSQI